MTKQIILRPRDVRKVSNQFHVNNFHNSGWFVRDPSNTVWVRMTTDNTRIKNPQHDPAVHDPDDPDFPLYLVPYSPAE